MFQVWGMEELTECTWPLPSRTLLSILTAMSQETEKACVNWMVNLCEHACPLLFILALCPGLPSASGVFHVRDSPFHSSSSLSSHSCLCSILIPVTCSHSVPVFVLRVLVKIYDYLVVYLCIYSISVSHKAMNSTLYIYPWPITWPDTCYKLSRKGKMSWWMDYWMNEYGHTQFWK